MRNLNTSPDLRLLRALVVAIAWAALANAIDPGRAMSQYVRVRWGPEQGFPRGAVYAIGQSEDGYLWIGTEAGLVRFDGLEFRTIHDVPGLENDRGVLGLISDGHGNLWIRLETSLLRYHNGAFDSPIGSLDGAWLMLSGNSTSLRFFFAFLGDFERYGDLPPLVSLRPAPEHRMRLADASD